MSQLMFFDSVVDTEDLINGAFEVLYGFITVRNLFDHNENWPSLHIKLWHGTASCTLLHAELSVLSMYENNKLPKLGSK